MRKIVSLFKRDYDGTRLVYDQVVPGAEWVVKGEGVATAKFDGTACMVRDGRLYKRYDVKKGRKPPPNFEPAQDPDPTTGHWPGWVPVGDGPEDKWFREAWENARDATEDGAPVEDGTYELCGPKVQGNPHRFGSHTLVPHGIRKVDAPRTFDALREWFGRSHDDHEGVVWHHPDGRMVKIKRKDFGWPWPTK